MQTKIKKENRSEDTRNRKGKRSDIAWVRGAKMRRKKAIAGMVAQKQAEERREAIKIKTAKVVKRREERDVVRKEIAKKERVNWKRVVLMSKIEKGKLPEYVIKK